MPSHHANGVQKCNRCAKTIKTENCFHTAAPSDFKYCFIIPTKSSPLKQMRPSEVKQPIMPVFCKVQEHANLKSYSLKGKAENNYSIQYECLKLDSWDLVIVLQKSRNYGWTTDWQISKQAYNIKEKHYVSTN